ncbi:lamin tail domain-containing protein [Candidatus Berkelbacteria bacterium]|nr:lamin tail domain-containing protein [Candidatus Berkelbacteria bacterium]
MRLLKGIIYVMVSSLSGLLMQSPVLADEPDAGPAVMISELAWAGSSVSTADEWLELQNRTTGVIDLAEWSLWDVAVSPAKLMLTIPSSQIGGGGGTFLIANNGPDHVFGSGTSVLASEPDLIDSDVSLSNTKLKLELRNASGMVLDTIGNGGAGFLRDSVTPRSMERILTPLGLGTAVSGWQLATTKRGIDATAPDFGTPTPSGRPSLSVPKICRFHRTADGSESSVNLTVTDPTDVTDIATVVVTLGDEPVNSEQTTGPTSREVTIRAPDTLSAGPVRLTVTAVDQGGLSKTVSLSCQRTRSSQFVTINEVMANPESGGQEFVELANVGDQPAQLYGWTLDDRDDGGSSPFTINYPLVLAPQTTVVLWKSETGLALNNEGDDIQILAPTGDRVDLVRYTGGSKGLSWDRGQPWYWTSPTPGTPNNDAPPITLTPQGGGPTSGIVLPITLSEIVRQHQVLSGQTVETEVTVVVAQGLYHERRLIVTDQTDFAELQVREGQQLMVAANDRLKVRATVSSSTTPRLLLETVTDATLRHLVKNRGFSVDRGTVGGKGGIHE